MYDEDDDETDVTISCPNCNLEIYEDAPRCPHCGEYITGSNRNPFSTRSSWFRNLIVVVIALTILSFLLPYLLTLAGLLGKE